MNLIELKGVVDDAIENAKECEYDPTEVYVSLQVELKDKTAYSKKDIEAHFDCDSNASGFVFVGDGFEF